MKENEDEKIFIAPTSPDELQSKKSIEGEDSTASLGSQKVYKKTSSNQLLTLYLGTRELISRDGTGVEPVKGIIYIDPKVVESNQKVFCQLTLTFRYGREDEEVMGLKFCNEAIITLQQIWPKPEVEPKFELSNLQEALIDRLGKNSIPFAIEIGSITPPSVQLLPAKRYTGAPIGTSYDIRVYTVPTADPADDRIQRRSTVRLGIRLIHKICPERNLVNNEPSLQPTVPRSLRLRLSPKARKLIKQTSLIIHGTNNNNTNNSSNGNEESMDVVDSMNRGPQGCVDKPFLWTEGRVNLKASLNKSAYTHGENVNVTIDVRNDSRKVVRKIRIFAVQHVDVCMFSNGKFKNVVAEVDMSRQIGPGETLHGVYSLLPIRGTTKNWIAVEGALFSTSNYDTSLAALNSKLASSAPKGNAFTFYQPQLQSSSSSYSNPTTSDERNVFAIYVSYYVKVKLSLSGMGGEVTLKLPFILGNIETDGSFIDKTIEPNHTNDLHLNDHQTLNDIRRPSKSFERSESVNENKLGENIRDIQILSRNSSVNCKSIDYDDDVINIVNDISRNNEGIEYINQKFSEMNRRNSTRSTDSSASDVDDTESAKQEISVIQAQVHCTGTKYLESDI